MGFIPFCSNVMKKRYLRIFESKFQRKSRKKPKHKIRPANAIFDGVVKPVVEGLFRTILPVRGRKHYSSPIFCRAAGLGLEP